MTGTPSALFARIVAERASQPFVTYYDERTGERSELSAKSLGNWVAKTHFLLQDELGLGVGDTAFVALDPDWAAVAVVLGCWSAGLAVTDDASAEVAFVNPATAASAAGVPEVFALNPGALSRTFGPNPPEGTQDYVTAVRPQPDAWASVRPAAAPDDAALGGGRELSGADVIATATALVAAHAWAPGARLLRPIEAGRGPDWTRLLVVPLVLAGSVVLVADADEQTLGRRAQQERAEIFG